MPNKTNVTNVSQKGVSYLGLLSIALTVLFVALKLTGFIGWSWVWVLAPFWGYIALCISAAILFFLALFVILVIAFIVAVFKEIFK